MADVVDPVESAPDRHGWTKVTHPAFGQIRVNRVSGSAVLHGSDFLHHNYVMIEIHHGQIMRDGAHDTYHDSGRQIIRLTMSEAQWAAFVCSFAQGAGVPCTIDYLMGVSQPELPPPSGRVARFVQETTDTQKRTIERVTELMKSVQKGKIAKHLTAKAKDLLQHELSIIHSWMVSNIPYVGKQFTEHVERVTEQAKVEINAHLTQTVMRAGLERLGAEPPAIELPAAWALGRGFDPHVIDVLRTEAAAGAGHDCGEWIKDGKCQLCDRMMEDVPR